MKGRKFIELSAQLIFLFSENGSSYHSWCSINGRCYYYFFIIAVYEVMCLNQINATNSSFFAPASVKVPGTCGKLDYCSQSSLPCNGIIYLYPFLCKAHFLQLGAEYTFCMTCFGQWDISRHDIDRSLWSGLSSCIPDHIY